MSDDEIFTHPGDMPWETLGRINEDGYVEDPSLEDSPVIFDDQFEMRSRELERRPGNTQPIFDTYPKTGPWSRNNQLGIQQAFAPDTNNLQTILKLDEWGFPEEWTVTLGIDFDQQKWADTGSGFFGITALINFGVGGATQQVEVDWKQGASITLTMNALNVIARYELVPSESGATFEAPPDLKLRVTLSKGAGRNACPTRTYLVGTAGASPAIVPIPPFAKSVYLLPGNSIDPFLLYSSTEGAVFKSSTSSISSSPIATLNRSQFVSYLNIVEEVVGAPMAVPIPEAARALHLGNISAGESSVTVIYNIGL